MSDSGHGQANANSVSRRDECGFFSCRNRADRFPYATPSASPFVGANIMAKLYPRKASLYFPFLYATFALSRNFKEVSDDLVNPKKRDEHV